MIEEDIHMAMSEAIYEKTDDNEYIGKIPCCWGVIAFAPTLEKCKDELLSVLEDWILVGLRLGHPLPVVGGIDHNKELSLFKTCSYDKFIKRLRRLGFEGEYHGTKHDYMIFGHHRLCIGF